MLVGKLTTNITRSWQVQIVVFTDVILSNAVPGAKPGQVVFA